MFHIHFVQNIQSFCCSALHRIPQADIRGLTSPATCSSSQPAASKQLANQQTTRQLNVALRNCLFIKVRFIPFVPFLTNFQINDIRRKVRLFKPILVVVQCDKYTNSVVSQPKMTFGRYQSDVTWENENVARYPIWFLSSFFSYELLSPPPSLHYLRV